MRFVAFFIKQEQQNPIQMENKFFELINWLYEYISFFLFLNEIYTNY